MLHAARGVALSTQLFGTRLPRTEDLALITGQGRYVDDIKLPGMLQAAFLRSPHAHARISSIDTTAAAQLEGVHAVLTLDDLGPEHADRPMLQAYPNPRIKQNILPHLLARDEVALVGQTVALVVADNRYIAEDALALIEVDYQPLPAVVDCRKALDSAAPKAHSSAPNNLAASFSNTFGDTEAAFKHADEVYEIDFLQHRGGCHATECRGVIAQYSPHQDGLTLWSSTQCPYLIRRMLARQLDLPESRVRVIAPNVGGGFGPKAGFYVEEVVTAIAAIKLGRPVKWIEDRREHFTATNTQRDQHWHLDVAADNKGHILGVRGRAILDSGAFLSYGLLLPFTTLAPLPGPYAVEAVDVQFDVVFTNTTPNSPVRGAGRPNAAYAMERCIEAVARGLQLDPAEVRRINLIKQEQFPYATGQIHPNGRPIVYDSGDYIGTLDKAMALGDYAGFKKRQVAARQQDRYLGIGIGACVEDTGVGPYEGCTVRVDPSGEVLVESGAADQGQGHRTIIAQIVADGLGVPFERVHVTIGDTGKFPQGVGTIGSRVGVNVGTAANDAAASVRKKALEFAAKALEVNAAELEIEAGIVRVTHVPEMSIALGEVALRLTPMTGGAVPEGFTPGLEATSYAASKGPPHANGVNIAEVEVDIDTGKVKILRYSVAHDCGTMINPMIVDGQLIGGVVHGIGNALFEQMIYDEAGQPQTTTYADYLLPLATEMPRIDIVHQETPSPLNPLGLKGAGEGGTIPAAAAVVAAIENALESFGVVIGYYPVTPQRLVELITAGAGERCVEAMSTTPPA
ncbi:MAG: xanthine dehydrogenase family protein molybdopterin-binding subunit [Gammaproteobacteria bacterium]|nr:xanthine dehydrogenase family protein molybdopterin-binding subunit [Gammaproteobacteria bacterium]